MPKPDPQKTRLSAVIIACLLVFSVQTHADVLLTENLHGETKFTPGFTTAECRAVKMRILKEKKERDEAFDKEAKEYFKNRPFQTCDGCASGSYGREADPEEILKVECLK